jgi:hypothetical protein
MWKFTKYLVILLLAIIFSGVTLAEGSFQSDLAAAALTS